MHDKVTRLRQLMSEAIPLPQPPSAANEDAWRAYQLFEFNTAPPPPSSPRDRAVRAINLISMRYNWGVAVQRFLDGADATGIHELADAEVESLREHMEWLVLCAQTGCDDVDALPAR